MEVGADSNTMSKSLADESHFIKENTTISISWIDSLYLNIGSRVRADIWNRDMSFDIKLDIWQGSNHKKNYTF